MTSPGIERRIFVVGAPRSGTTLVQSLLAAQGALTSYTESHFFDRHFIALPFTGTPILTRSPLPRLREFLTENGEPPTTAALELEAALASLPESARALRRRPWAWRRGRPVARGLLRVLDELALRRGTGGWIEKTPRHLRSIPFLEKLALEALGGVEPEAPKRTDFVHVIRDGLEVVASLHAASRSWERPYDLAACVRRWNTDVGLSLRRLGKPHDHFVFYEELAADPEPTLRRLLADLGLDWQPALLARYAETSQRLITAAEPWKADVGRAIHPSATSSQTLSAEQRRWVARRLRRDRHDRLLEAHRGRRGAAPAATPQEHGGDLPCVSVVVPFFDSERHLAACIESLLGQEDVGGRFEILLIDNGSTDGSAAVAARYAESHRGVVTLLRETKPGAYAARSTGIRHARAPILAFTDADCTADRHWLRALRRGLEDPAVAVLVGHCRYPDEASPVLRLLGAYENAKASYVLGRCPPAYRFAYANNMAVRASVFEQLGPFEEWPRAADSELVHRLAARRPELRVAYLPAMRIVHREFLRARDRARRLSLYARTNSQIEGFRELTVRRRAGLLLHLLGGRWARP